VIAPLRPDDPPAIGPYCLVGRLGGGGMGQVFLGQSADGQPVAVKVIRAELASDPEFRTRFRQEVAAARKVGGKFTAQVVDADLDGSVQWLATTYVAGPSLAEAVNSDGPLPLDKVLWLAAGLAEGLSAIHAAGVVHRDLKPANVLLTEDGPRVIDFGICWAAWASANPGSTFGSPRFMSPEHALGQIVGPPSDIFSLGAVLTFAATGQGPFGSGSNAALIYRLVNSPARLDCMPAELRELAGSCLAKHPGDRPSASDLLAQVGAIQRECGRGPEPASGTPTQGQWATQSTGSKNGAKLPALAGAPAAAELAVAEPQPGSARRDLRRRVSRSLPLFVPGLAAALAVAIFLVSRAATPTPFTVTQPQAGVTASAVQAQPQAGGAVTVTAPTPVVTVTAHPRRRQIGAAIIQGPSASGFLSPSAFTTTLPVPSGSEPVTLGSPASSSSSGSGSASAKPSKSGSPSPTASKSGSPSPTASKSGSSSPAPSSSSPAPSSSSSTPAPSSSSATPSPTAT
jgi:eukaryotic-like serine/threonine-protein kinase